jgi:hypothetical protein
VKRASIATTSAVAAPLAHSIRASIRWFAARRRPELQAGPASAPTPVTAMDHAQLQVNRVVAPATGETTARSAVRVTAACTDRAPEPRAG